MWLHRSNNNDFKAKHWHEGGKEKVFKDSESEALLNKDSCQSQKELRRPLLLIPKRDVKTAQSSQQDS